MLVPRAVVAADPAVLAIAEAFLFPDRHAGFDFVDDVAAGVEGGVAVGGGDADDDGEPADFKRAGAVGAGGS